jgi:ribosomal protein S18 acetylase RimI-like enzyme
VVGEIVVRALGESDRGWAGRFLRAAGSEVVAAHGMLLRPLELPALVAVDGEDRIALLTHRIEDGECEVVTLHSDREGVGAGTALLEAAEREARASACRRLWLITTNDNLHALRFYQRRGFRLAAVRPGAVDESRRTLKPEIPLTGDGDIPIRDEIELELRLDG